MPQHPRIVRRMLHLEDYGIVRGITDRLGSSDFRGRKTRKDRLTLLQSAYGAVEARNTAH